MPNDSVAPDPNVTSSAVQNSDVVPSDVQTVSPTVPPAAGSTAVFSQDAVTSPAPTNGSVSQPSSEQAQDTLDTTQLSPAILQAAADIDTLNVGGGGANKNKEGQAATLAGIAEAPSTTTAEQEPNPETPPEVENWTEKVAQHEMKQPQEVKIVVPPPNPTDNQKVYENVTVLPLTQSAFKQGLKASITASIRWLATWCLRIMKKLHGKIAYQGDEGLK